MKLIIQIPCFNEETTLPQVIRDLPRELPGVDRIEYLVIDDGSQDRTAEVARELGVHHVFRLGSNRGLATAFVAGIRRAVELGADVIVNTDGDNQYRGECIKDLIAPVVEGRADVVVGCRPIADVAHFSWIKKKLQRFGSYIVRKFSGTAIPDATSGFRAYSAEAAMRLHVFNRYTYTLETIIQAGHLNMRIIHVPIQINPKTRDSRLISSIPKYIWKGARVIVRSYVIYQPLRAFSYAALLAALPGLAICVRFLYYFFTEDTAGHMQSLLLAVLLLLIAFQLMVVGLIADLVRANRELIEENTYQVRKHSYRDREGSG